MQTISQNRPARSSERETVECTKDGAPRVHDAKNAEDIRLHGMERQGSCPPVVSIHARPADRGSHTVCVVTTAEFLEYSKSRGNDLSTPMPEFGFRGLKPGDRWCLCAPRWQEALESGQAPRVVLRATHEDALSYCSLADLKRFAVDLA